MFQIVLQIKLDYETFYSPANLMKVQSHASSDKQQ